MAWGPPPGPLPEPPIGAQAPTQGPHQGPPQGPQQGPPQAPPLDPPLDPPQWMIQQGAPPLQPQPLAPPPPLPPTQPLATMQTLAPQPQVPPAGVAMAPTGGSPVPQQPPGLPISGVQMPPGLPHPGMPPGMVPGMRPAAMVPARTPPSVMPPAPNQQMPPQPSHQQQQQSCPPSAQSQQRNRVTAFARPVGIDPLLALQERENRVAARIALRIEELSNLPTTMPDDLRIKAQIELRSLRVLNFQRQLRREVLSCTKRDTSLETAVNVKAYKRTKHQGLREARATENLEKQQKLEVERERRQKHQEFLTSVLQHGQYFKEYHRNNLARIARVNNAVLNYHANAERKQKKEEERIEKERMHLLMAEDEEGYRKLIDQNKDKLLAFPLSQTDDYIGNLAEVVKQDKVEQKRKQQEMKQKKKRKKKKKIAENGEGREAMDGQVDETSHDEDKRITVLEISTGKTLYGEDAPLMSQLQAWLNAHPGWESVPLDEDDEDDDDEEGSDDDHEFQINKSNAMEEDEAC